MHKYAKALREKMVKDFTLRPHGWAFRLDGTLFGVNIRSVESVVFQIKNGLEQLDRINLDHTVFDLKFETNGVSFQLQHNALKWMELHELVPILIQNHQYFNNEEDEEDEKQTQKYELR